MRSGADGLRELKCLACRDAELESSVTRGMPLPERQFVTCAKEFMQRPLTGAASQRITPHLTEIGF